MEACAPGRDVIICIRQLFFIVFFKRVDFLFFVVVGCGERPSSADLIGALYRHTPNGKNVLFLIHVGIVFSLAEIVDDEMQFLFFVLKM